MRTTVLPCFWALLAAVSAAEDGERITAMAGNNITLSSCGSDPDQVWIKNGNNRGLGGAYVSNRARTLQNGSLFIADLDRAADSGTYSCRRGDGTQSRIELDVKSAPSAVANLSVIPHSVFALVTWSQTKDSGGFPVEKFVLTYSLLASHLANETWSPKTFVVDDIPASSTSRTVFNLLPNSTYTFVLYAVNELGNGRNLTVEADTVYSTEEIAQAKQLHEGSLLRPSFHVVKIFLIVIGVVLVTLAILALGISLVLFKSCRRSVVRVPEMDRLQSTEEEVMELVPHITLNPSFNIDMLEYIEASEISPMSECRDPPSGNRHGRKSRDEDRVNLVDKMNNYPNG